VGALVLTGAGADAAGAAAPASCPGPDDPSFGAAQEFTGEFDSSLEGGYVQIPFSVPAGATGVRVRYCFDQPDIPLPNGINANTLDLGIFEPRDPGDSFWGLDELRGWSGGSVRDATVAVNGFSDEATYSAARKGYVHGRTTRAYRPGPIPAGDWAVELGLAAISSQGEGNFDGKVAWRVQVQTTSSADFADEPYSPATYDAGPEDPDPGWYAGDFHVHGEHEPGNALMRDTFEFAFSPLGQDGAGLDFVTLVDHNNTVAYGEIGRLQADHPGKLITRGTEITTYRGHFQDQASGVMVDYRTGPIHVRDAGGSLTQARGPTPPSSSFDAVHAAGGFTQINHPTIFPSNVPGFSTFCRGCPWDHAAADTDFSKVDAIEVQTGPAGLDQDPRPGPNPFTPLAIEFWEDAIDSGGTSANHIAAVGSSDSHQAGEQGGDVDAITSAPIGEGQTVVYAEELSEAAIDDAVKAGHTYVKVFGSDGPDLRLEASEPGSADPPAIIGDTLDAESATFSARVLGLDRARAARPGVWTLRVVRDGLPFVSVPIPPAGDEFEFEFPSLGQARYRLQVERAVIGGAAIEAVSSPIYMGPDDGGPPPPPPPVEDCATPLEGTDGRDSFTGTEHGDDIRGGGGRDKIAGKGGDDCLRGGRGRDLVVGGTGEDSIAGDRGRDRLKAADGERDLVRCGRSRRDRARVDRIDRVRGCEHIRPRGA
jgi:hypothetical protein